MELLSIILNCSELSYQCHKHTTTSQVVVIQRISACVVHAFILQAISGLDCLLVLKSIFLLMAWVAVWFSHSFLNSLDCFQVKAFIVNVVGCF